MFNPQNHREKRQDVFMSSIEGIANIMALITAFLLTPEIHIRTVSWITRIAATRYGAGEYLDLVSMAWLAIVALLTFFTARATLATAIVAAGLAAATKII